MFSKSIDKLEVYKENEAMNNSGKPPTVKRFLFSTRR